MENDSDGEGIASYCSDPITYDLMDDAVVSPYGHTFSESSIATWLEMSSTCPITQKPLKADMLRPNYTVRKVVENLRKDAGATRGKSSELERADDLQRDIVQAEVEVDMLVIRMERLERDMEQLQREVRAARIQRDEAEAKVQAESAALREGEEADLRRKLGRVRDYIEQLEREDNRCSMHIHNRKKLMRERTEHLAELRSKQKRAILGFTYEREIQAAEREIFDMEKSVMSLIHDAQSVAEQKSDKADVMILLEKELLQLAEENDCVRRGMRPSVDELERMKGVMVSFRSREDGLRSVLTEARAAFQRATARREKLRVEVSTTVTSLEAMLERFRALPSVVRDEVGAARRAASLKEEGNEHFRNGRMDEAVSSYTKAIVLYKEPAYFLNRAAAYTHLKRFDQALEDARIAVEWKGVSPALLGKAYRRMATAYLAQGKRIDAAHSLTRALAVDENDTLAKQLMARVNEK
mmetsp:Transcript_9846/g.27656  ORF Transcript_9846/g.27656 Transcript_9846/m.27656 type:complete len:469 (+) Transcript_9846:58-1464(+)|eukprot:CAMPEP_0119147592 /NCGR_PEP_ID=MMETSP1310-20130426/40589_1 /TAXON_ID=464262 /ORGANISM="Genus nov. species nov., Strain RCC2339" /LENGTH=468 /DNA_ID=CAMNT_0007139569 /DNA_START=40 /DNA_END=1446 /DNA_ORIENTATION=-